MDDNLDSVPAAYAQWRVSTLGRITDALEQDLILELVGPAGGSRVLDEGRGDGALAAALSGRDASRS